MAIAINSIADFQNIVYDEDYYLNADLDFSGHSTWESVPAQWVTIETGTTEATTLKRLLDSTQNFLSTVNVGDRVINTTTLQETEVYEVLSNILLRVRDNYFQNAEDTYEVSRLKGYEGTFEGNNHTINNFNMLIDVSDDFQGLFSHAKNGTIQNLIMTNSTITINTGAVVGTLLGYAENASIINCVASGSIEASGNESIGGMIGFATGSCYFKSCISNVNISISGSACYMSGGFLGEILIEGSEHSTIEDCSSTGDITSTAYMDNCGGLIGYLAADDNSYYNVVRCFSTGNILINGSGSEFIGGLVGLTTHDSTIIPSFNNVYSTGDITITVLYGSYCVGGLFGYLHTASLIDSYYNGDITINTTSGGDADSVGGIIGLWIALGKEYLYNCYSICNINISVIDDVDEYSEITNIGGLIGVYIGDDEATDFVRIYNIYHLGIISLEASGIYNEGIRAVGGCFGDILDGNGTTINKVFHEGNITCTATDTDDIWAISDIGGFSGIIILEANSLIKDTYSHGNITCYVSVLSSGLIDIGGYVGYFDSLSHITNSYSSCDIKINCGYSTNVSLVGGFAGNFSGIGDKIGINLFSCGVIDLRDISDILFGDYSSEVGGFFGALDADLVNCHGYTFAYPLAENLNPRSIGSPISSLAGLGYGADEDNANAFKYSTHEVFNTNAIWHKGQFGQYDFSPIKSNGFPPDFAYISTFGRWFDHSAIGLYPDFRMHNGEFPGDADLGEDYDLVDAEYDCGYAGVATNQILNLSHLEGQTVSILANGVVLDQQVVSGGTVDLDGSYSVAHVGLPFEADLETLAIEVPHKEGTVQAKKVKVNNVTFRMERSRGGFIGSDVDNLWEAMTKDAINYCSGQNLDEMELFTGDLRQPLTGQFSNGGNIFFRQIDPLPITIGAIIPETNIAGQVR